jgi:hypothetical protein
VARIGKLLCLILGAATVAVAEPRIELTVDQTDVAMGDEITAQVIVRGAQRAPEPQIDGLQAFESERTGTSSQVQIINGATTLSVVFNYSLVPKGAGTFTLGPARANVGGVAIVSQPVQIRVAQGQQAAKPAADRPFQVLAEVDKPQAYVGQQLVYTFQFLSRGELHNARLNFPDFKGFLKEELGKQRQFESVRNGVRWVVTEIKVALFPTQAGDISIAPASLMGDAMVPDEGGRGRRSPFDDFFDSGFFGRSGRMKRVKLDSPGLIVKVLDLPAAGKPSPFSGIIGSLSVRQSLSKTSVAVGDSVTWTVEMSGQGNLRDARWETPALSGFKAYDDQPNFQPSLNGNRIGGTKVFKKALVPLEGGRREIPALEIGYFDPDKGVYRTAKAPALALEVAPGQVPANLVTAPSRQAVAVRGEDILAPRWESATVEADALTGPERVKLGVLWACGPLLFGLTAGGLAYRRRRSGNRQLVRRSRAYGSFRKIAAKWNGNASFDGLDGALRAYLGDRFDTDGGALTPLDVKEKIGHRGVSEDLVRETKEVLELCERARYGGGGDPGPIRERVVRLVEGLEKEERR